MRVRASILLVYSIVYVLPNHAHFDAAQGMIAPFADRLAWVVIVDSGEERTTLAVRQAGEKVKDLHIQDQGVVLADGR